MILPRICIRKKSGTRTGFTLIELLVVLGILAVLIGLGLFFSMDTYRGASFRSERDIAIGVLQKARSQAVTNINQSRHGVYIDSVNSKYWVFEGDSFAGASGKIDFPMGNNNAVILSGSSEIVFDQLTGNPLSPSSITLTNRSDNKTLTINVNSEGRIDY